jgi:hypothetical protein
MEINRQSSFAFVFAKSFVHKDRESFFDYKKNKIEKVGSFLRSGVGESLDYFLRNIKDPITIVALTSISMVAATICFYPAQSMALVPFITHIKPYMVKFSLYLISQITVLGIGLRTFGRLNNLELMEQWNNKSLITQIPGDQISDDIQS